MPRTSASDRVAFWRKLIARQASSRLTVGELCRQAGVSTASFYAWRQRLNGPDVATRQSSLVPVRVVADRGGEITVELVDTATQAPLTRLPTMRVAIPPGCDEASIRRVLCAALSARQGGSSC